MTKTKDLTGQRFGRLTVVERTNKRNKSGKILYRCKCECGGEKLVSATNLLNGGTRSCGCLNVEAHQRTQKDLSGQRFGNLIAIKPTAARRQKKVIWECLCDCGKTVFVSCTDLLTGNTRSCGCLLTKNQPTMIKNTLQDNTNVGRIKSVKTSRNNTSGCKGVYQQGNKWIARIDFQKTAHYLGCFENFDDAVAARKAAELKYFGEYLKNKTGQ
jgi:hypothetical protein